MSTEPESYDGTITAWGHTLTVEAIRDARMHGINIWTTLLLGHPVPLADGDSRNLRTHDENGEPR
jgi:hypothetical protein